MRVDPRAVSGEILIEMKMDIDDVIAGYEKECTCVGVAAEPLARYIAQTYKVMGTQLHPNTRSYYINKEVFDLIEDKYGVTFKLVN